MFTVEVAPSPSVTTDFNVGVFDGKYGALDPVAQIEVGTVERVPTTGVEV
jgi:hypothetical protein